MAVEYRPPVSVISAVQIEWERKLPVPGQVLVRVGDRVEAMDVVARALQPGKMFAIDAARDLGIGNAALPRYMLKTESEEVRAQEILAIRGGILKKRCVSPVAGTIRAVVQGRILLEREPMAVELRSYVRGEVSRLISNYGAAIRTTGALIRGAWGSGKDAYGVIRVVVADRDEALTEDLVDASCHGAIVVGGASVTAAALDKAEEVSVRAVVVGGMDASLIKHACSMTYPVFVTQAMGHWPILSDVFHLYKLHQGREAVIMQKQMLRGVARPEMLISVPPGELGQMAHDSEPRVLVVGGRVNLTRPPFTGMAGEVVGMPGITLDTETGLQYRGVDVRLDDGRSVTVPVTNLDLIEGVRVSPEG